MISNSKNDYFGSKTYIGYIFGKIKKGDLWHGISSLYRKIRKYTLISAIIKTSAIIISLLEKSALLLLFTSALLLLLPALLIITLFLVGVSATKCIYWHKTVKEWISGTENVTVYLSSEKIFDKKAPLFLRMARTEAAEYRHPVIVLCRDSFTSLKWYSINLLAIKPDYFFLMKKFFFARKGLKVTYIVLS